MDWNSSQQPLLPHQPRAATHRKEKKKEGGTSPNSRQWYARCCSVRPSGHFRTGGGHRPTAWRKDGSGAEQPVSWNRIEIEASENFAIWTINTIHMRVSVCNCQNAKYISDCSGEGWGGTQCCFIPNKFFSRLFLRGGGAMPFHRVTTGAQP